MYIDISYVDTSYISESLILCLKSKRKYEFLNTEGKNIQVKVDILDDLLYINKRGG